ncbi:MAG TPA: carboxypeptidase-like regulatory domain-containing protein [Methylomirabilota bacterium]|nr:carboxypeptidase-like regulatory domain-containing protein [Methylomirabilota bacterium]
MRRRLLLFSMLGFVILGVSSKPSYSQAGASGAQFNGTVRDESGGTVAKASITLRETDTNRTYTTVSNDSGLYVLANLLRSMVSI